TIAIQNQADTNYSLLMESQSGNQGYITMNNNNIEAVRFNSNGNSFFNGGILGVGTVSPVAGLDVQQAITAASAVAYGLRQQQTLTAAANNDALYGLYLNTTYSDASKTGVTHVDLGFDGQSARTISMVRE